jgi:predicted alpha/beta superfamily hydrolase
MQAEYLLYVSVPEGYDGTQLYPVVVLLDGDWYFDRSYRIPDDGVRGIVYNLSSLGLMPDAVLVGIGYPNGNERGRDFAQYPDTFYNVITEEMLPVLESQYPIDPSAPRTIMGHSSGGYFVLYSLFKHRDDFQNYVVASAPIYDNNKLLLSKELSFYNKVKDAPVGYSLYLCVGGLEEQRFTDSYADLSARLAAKQYEGFRICTVKYPPHNHLSIVYPAFTDGLVWIFSE